MLGFACVHRVQLILDFPLVLENTGIQRRVSVSLQEWSLENALDKMQAEWAGLCFETLPWRATGCTILRAVDDIQQVGPCQPALPQTQRYRHVQWTVQCVEGDTPILVFAVPCSSWTTRSSRRRRCGHLPTSGLLRSV
jgi:hypothetical protein